MLTGYLKTYALKELKMKVMLLIIMIAILVIMYMYSKTSNVKEIDIEKEYKRVQNDVSEVENTINISLDSIKTWKAEAKNVLKDRSGIKVKIVGKIIDELKDDNHLRNLNITLSAPEVRRNLRSSKYSQVVFSTGSINFNAYTDIDVFNFINKFLKGMPGFIHIKALSLTSAGKLDKVTSIEDINKLVTVKLDFLWQDIQDIQVGSNENKNDDTLRLKNFVEPK
jgi:hypothetical protein